MSAKKVTQYPNLSANLYDGNFDTSFECIGVERCQFALCPEMPPTGDDECCYVEYGVCRRVSAQLEALRILRIRVTTMMKGLEEEP